MGTKMRRFPAGKSQSTLLPGSILPSVIAGFQGGSSHSSALSFSVFKLLVFPPVDCRPRPHDLGTRAYGPEHWGPGFACAGSCSSAALKLCQIGDIRQVG